MLRSAELRFGTGDLLGPHARHLLLLRDLRPHVPQRSPASSRARGKVTKPSSTSLQAKSSKGTCRGTRLDSFVTGAWTIGTHSPRTGCVHKLSNRLSASRSRPMMKIVRATPVRDRVLRLEFSDGTSGDYDLTPLISRGTSLP